jgi:heat-inducible transcriptional repressor
MFLAMEDRKKHILNTLIKEHIKTGAPVGSGVLVEKYKLDISPATARNEMAELENDGYIIQPHTSAGRIPTEKAYRYYLIELKEKKLHDDEIKALNSYLKKGTEEAFKLAAKELARLSGNAIIWAHDRRNLYYTGISNLLTQPEFARSELIYDISYIIDQLEEIVYRTFDQAAFEPEALIGSLNPYSNLCSSIQFRYNIKNRAGLVVMLAPVRMDYEKGLALMRLVHEKLAGK